MVERSKGAALWDLDGNEYVDVLNGFGMNLFGWQPDFVNEAVRKQLDAGYEIGPQHPLAGEVAKLVCELTGFDRAGLCNTGSEAVMAAVRIARTVTGRNTIVLFTGSYHGIFDEVHRARRRKRRKGMPAAPGIMPACLGDVRRARLRHARERCEFIRANADDLAAVLVEPVQSRRPDFQPREFLQRGARDHREDAARCLIFDEVITGFRSHPGGAQALFGIRADLASYGKVIGGGFPVGVIAGKRDYMDALDGGLWQYGDDSIPTVGVTYFAGTFVRHPLALAAAKAALEHLKARGPELQTQLNVQHGGHGRRAHRVLPRGGRADRDPPLRLAVARELARGPSAAGPAVRDDAQPRRAHPRQLPLLHDDRAHRSRTSRSSSRPSRNRSPRCRRPSFLPRRAAPTVLRRVAAAQCPARASAATRRQARLVRAGSRQRRAST